MKKIIVFVVALAACVAAFAQTPEEIISRMEAEMSAHEAEGVVMTMDVKIPLVGTMSTSSWSLGNKLRLEGKVSGILIVTWTDGTTQWTYNSHDNEIEITADKGKAAEDSGDAGMFSGIADGYSVTLESEDDTAWYLSCRKSKSNKDKDAPKSISLSVYKGSYYPKSLSTKASGVTFTLRDVSFGVSPEQVTFNPADYPGAKIKDKR